MLIDLAVGISGTITRPVDANTAFLSPLYFKLAEQCLDCFKFALVNPAARIIRPLIIRPLIIGLLLY